MKPNLQRRRIVTVPATLSWEHTIRHRIYSCPDKNAFEHVWGATCLVLLNNITGARVPLEVTAVVSLVPEATFQVDALAEPFRTRLLHYQEAVEAIAGILEPGTPHRFYFLSQEPWADWLQHLTTPERCPDTEWKAILSICTEPSRFFEWPQVGTLLWPGCARGGHNHLHQYPPELTARLLNLGLGEPDTRSNGPAIMAFLAARGVRPAWGAEGWPIHHIYDGTVPIERGPEEVLHAIYDGQHFTHSAGLVATHPVAHHLAHHSTLLKWFLRREAFLRFGYDPMHVF